GRRRGRGGGGGGGGGRGRGFSRWRTRHRLVRVRALGRRRARRIGGGLSPSARATGVGCRASRELRRSRGLVAAARGRRSPQLACRARSPAGARGRRGSRGRVGVR